MEVLELTFTILLWRDSVKKILLCIILKSEKQRVIYYQFWKYIPLCPYFSYNKRKISVPILQILEPTVGLAAWSADIEMKITVYFDIKLAAIIFLILWL